MTSPRLLAAVPLLALVAVGLPTRARAAPEEPVVLFDFSEEDRADSWVVRGIVVAETTTDEGRTVSGGGTLTLVADGEPERGRIGFARHAVDVHDWRTFRALSFHARVEADAPVRMRVMAYSDRAPAALLRRFVLEPGGWREVVLPLSWFREDTVDPVCDFSNIEVVLFRWDATPGRVTLDDVRLIPGERGTESCLADPDERGDVLFGEAGYATLESESFVLITDALGAEGDVPGRAAGLAFLARCEDGLRVLRDAYGITGPMPDRAPVVVCRQRATFEAAIERLGAHYGVGIAPPTADGLSVLGVALGSLDDAGWERPSLVHEAMHAALHRLIGISTNSNWVQEGLAAGVQARLFPESIADVDFGTSFRQRLVGKGPFPPFATLFRDRGTGLRHYAQYLSVFEFLADEHRDRLPAVWDAVRAVRGYVHRDALPAIAGAVDLSPEVFEARWLAWGLARYGEDDDG